MEFLPAIDILGGKVVRLAEGDYSKATVYKDDPVLQAQLFEQDGAKWIHVVDLDGAKTGNPSNRSVIEAILRATDLKVEVGGGIRDMETAKLILDAGATRVIFGTALIKDKGFAKEAIQEFGAPSVVAGIDAKDGDVKTEGWIEGAETSALKLASQMAELGYEHLVYTDIARDGMQTGIAPAAYVEMYQAFGNPVIASGGIARIEDIVELSRVEDAIEGVIAGRAIYEGAFTVAEGVAAVDGTLRSEPDFMADLERPLTIEDLK